MKRFDYDDEEFGEGVDRFFEMDEEGQQYISEEEYEALVQKASELQEAQLQLVELDINQRMLTDTIAMCQKSWFWKFKSMKNKLKEIGMAYKFFQKLTDTKGRMSS